MRVIALIPAAGVGKRMGQSISKPFLHIGGKAILAQTLLRFEDSDSISEVYVIISKMEERRCKEEIIEKYNLQKVTKIVIGGNERQVSVKNGLDAIEQGCDLVMIHDGNRPFITSQLIDESISKTRKCGATVVSIPVKDTVKTVSFTGEIEDTLDRKKLWLAQTPQTFQYDIIKEAYENAFSNNLFGYDDSSLVEVLGIRVRTIMGSYKNIKITTPEDLIIAEAFLED